MEPKEGAARVGNWAEILDQTPRGAPVSLVAPHPEGTRQNGHGGLIYQRIYEWVEYPSAAPMEAYKDDPNDPEEPEKERPARWWTPRSVGFRAKVLVNPLGGEVRIAGRLLAAWLTGAAEESAYLAALADRVVAWEYVIVREDGTRDAVEPPATGGWERFYDLPNDALIWLTREIRDAHLPKATTSGGRSRGPTGTTTPTPTSPEADPDGSGTPSDSGSTT